MTLEMKTLLSNYAFSNKKINYFIESGFLFNNRNDYNFKFFLRFYKIRKRIYIHMVTINVISTILLNLYRKKIMVNRFYKFRMIKIVNSNFPVK